MTKKIEKNAKRMEEFKKKFEPSQVILNSLTDVESEIEDIKFKLMSMDISNKNNEEELNRLKSKMNELQILKRNQLVKNINL